MPRAVADFFLAAADKATLQGWLRRGSTPNRLAQRARQRGLIGARRARHHCAGNVRAHAGHTADARTDAIALWIFGIAHGAADMVNTAFR